MSTTAPSRAGHNDAQRARRTSRSRAEEENRQVAQAAVSLAAAKQGMATEYRGMAGALRRVEAAPDLPVGDFFWLTLNAPSTFYDLSTDTYDDFESDDFFEEFHPDHEQAVQPELRSLLEGLSLHDDDVSGQHEIKAASASGVTEAAVIEEPKPAVAISGHCQRVGSVGRARSKHGKGEVARAAPLKPSCSSTACNGSDESDSSASSGPSEKAPEISNSGGSSPNVEAHDSDAQRGCCARSESGGIPAECPDASQTGDEGASSGGERVLSVHKPKKRSVGRAGLRTPDERASENSSRGRRVASPTSMAARAAAPQRYVPPSCTSSSSVIDEKEARDLLAELQVHNQRVVEAGVKAARERVHARSSVRTNNASATAAHSASSAAATAAHVPSLVPAHIPEQVPAHVPVPVSAPVAPAPFRAEVTTARPGRRVDAVTAPKLAETAAKRRVAEPRRAAAHGIRASVSQAASTREAAAVFTVPQPQRERTTEVLVPAEASRPCTSPVRGSPSESQTEDAAAPPPPTSAPPFSVLQPQQPPHEESPSTDTGKDTVSSPDAPGDVPEEFFCPITKKLMHDPVSTIDGQVFERAAIERWFKRHTSNPLTGEALGSTLLVPNKPLARLIAALAPRRHAAAAALVDPAAAPAASDQPPRFPAAATAAAVQVEGVRAEASTTALAEKATGANRATAAATIRATKVAVAATPARISKPAAFCFVADGVGNAAAIARGTQESANNDSGAGDVSGTGKDCCCGGADAGEGSAGKVFTFSAAPTATATAGRGLNKRRAAESPAIKPRSRREMLEEWQREREEKRRQQPPQDKSGRQVLAAVAPTSSRSNAPRQPASRVAAKPAKSEPPARDDGDELMRMLKEHNAKFGAAPRLHEQRVSSVAAMREWEKRNGKRFASLTSEERARANEEIMALPRNAGAVAL